MNNPYPNRIKLTGRSAFELRWRISDPRIEVGRGTYGDPKFILYSLEDRVSIGNFSSIAAGSTLLAGGEHNHGTTSTYPFHSYALEDPGPEVTDPMKVRYKDARYKGPLRIGSDVWIGYNALILSGVTVGHGSVIGAGAVVAKDVPPFSIAVGNPFQVVKKRFEDEVIERLLQIRWWDWDPKIILKYMSFLLGDPRAFLDTIDRVSEDERNHFYVIDPVHDAMEYEEIPPPTPVIPESLAKRMVRGLTPPFLYRGMRSIRTATRFLSKSVDNRGTLCRLTGETESKPKPMIEIGDKSSGNIILPRMNTGS